MVKTRILVTGGAGFIGSHIVDKLLRKDFEVTIFDNLSSGRWENISHHLDNELFHFIKGDILDLDTMKKIIKNHDVVFHEAAITDISFSVTNPRARAARELLDFNPKISLKEGIAQLVKWYRNNMGEK